MMKNFSRLDRTTGTIVAGLTRHPLKFIFLHFELRENITRACLLVCLLAYDGRTVAHSYILQSLLSFFGFDAIFFANCLIFIFCLVVLAAADGKYCLTAGSDKSVRLWNPCRLDPAYPPTTASIRQERSHPVDEDDTPASSLPRSLAVHLYEDGIRHTPTALDVSDDSTRIFVASDKTAVLLDSVSARAIRQFHGHVAVINSLVVVQQTDLLATASYDAAVCLWDGRSHNSRRPIQSLKEAKDSVTAVHIDPHSNCIRTASVDGCVRTYDMRMGVLHCDDCGSPITSLAHAVVDDESEKKPILAISCLDGAIRIKSDDLVTFSDSVVGATALLENGTEVPWICRDGHTAGRYSLGCAFLADGSAIVSGSENGHPVIYDAKRPFYDRLSSSNGQQPSSKHASTGSSGVLRTLMGHTAPTCSVAAHPKKECNDVIVTSGYDGQCVVWANSRSYMRWEDY